MGALVKAFGQGDLTPAELAAAPTLPPTRRQRIKPPNTAPAAVLRELPAAEAAIPPAHPVAHALNPSGATQHRPRSKTAAGATARPRSHI